MKFSTLLSRTALLAVLPRAAFAAPTASNEISARWFKDSKSTAPATTTSSVNTDSVDDADDEYVVILADDETRDIDDVLSEMGCNKTHVTSHLDTHVGRGFTMNMKKSMSVSMFSLPNVAIMEKNRKMQLAVMPREGPSKRSFMSRELLKGRKAVSLPSSENLKLDIEKRQNIYIQQSSAPWNLQRASSADGIQLDGRDATDLTFKYRFDQTAGAGVDVYMIDTGINTAHVDFQGRAQMIFTVEANNDVSDQEGHGTHTAGTVGSRTFGVAKNVNLFGLKVFRNDGSGSLTDSVNAIAAVMAQHAQRRKNADFAGSVVSMSLGAPGNSDLMTQAIQKAVAAGIHFSVAAGNDNDDACNTTPAGISGAGVPIMTVGATTIDDSKASFSNFGKCANIWAPGTQITSTFIGGNTATDVLQGTSMACPLVTGLIATELALNPNLKFDPAGMQQHLATLTLKNIVQDTSNSGPGISKDLANNGFPGNP